MRLEEAMVIEPPDPWGHCQLLDLDGLAFC